MALGYFTGRHWASVAGRAAQGKGTGRISHSRLSSRLDG
jgi:hypothetical protein